MLSLDTIDQEILTEMLSSVRKITNEVKIKRWKREAEKLRNVSMFNYKSLLGAIATYENNNIEAINYFDSAIALTQSTQNKAGTWSNIANTYAHLGDFSRAIDSMFKAFELTYSPEYYVHAFSICKLYYLNDDRLKIMKSLSPEQKKYYEESLQRLESTIEDFSNKNLNLDIYRAIIQKAFSVFFTYCNYRIHRFTEISDNNISTILFNVDLDIETVSLLNNDMNDALVDLLDTYEYDELLKYPIIFTSENFKNENVG